jgi:FAS-associated factor 2
LEADQRREREKLEHQRLKEEEERRIQEEIEKAETERLNKIDFAKHTLSMNGDEEPDPNDKSIKQARIRLMLPSGKRLDRRFRGDDTVDVIRSFLILHFHENDVGIENFQLSSNYPKKTLADGSKTLEEEDLCPQAVIMVQDLDA